ncbi:TetR/AcrR family transcriptional regulator [Novosphingobium sp.]|uniref:TetR/AcrR family transcriptional regulator n=1 Tax=Novosphingobium sp. TaxID=1874826 RepID=UPI0031D08CA6
MAKAKTYHKEDLRRDLLSAARSYVAENGYMSLSLRALAQQVNVSTAAPYHHFSDRRALLLAIAIEGFEDLIGRARTVSDSDESAEEKLVAMAEAFLDFAGAQPRLLELMYESELTTPEPDPSLRTYQDEGYAGLLSVMAKARQDLPQDHLSFRVMALWSTIYGYAMLRNKLMLEPFEPTSATRREVDRAIVLQAVKAALLD